MPEPRRYVVRIYRQGFRSLAGVVEDIATQGERTFRNLNELGEWLRAPIPRESCPCGETQPTPSERRNDE